MPRPPPPKKKRSYHYSLARRDEEKRHFLGRDYNPEEKHYARLKPLSKRIRPEYVTSRIKGKDIYIPIAKPVLNSKPSFIDESISELFEPVLMPRYAKKRTYKKKNAFKGTSSKVGRSAGALIGTALGGELGPFAPLIAGLGSTVGNVAGGLFSKITGIGDYQVSRNTILGKGKAVPVFGKASIRIRHKEFLGNISSSTSFSNRSYALNPGLESSFPWLSQLAKNFECYRFNGLVYQYRSTSADALNSTNTALGKVVAACEYNANDPDYGSVAQFYGSQFAISGPPSKNMLAGVECDQRFLPFNGLQLVRTGPVPSGSVIHDYDHGKFQFATDGSQAAAQIGELWAVYDVTLISPSADNAVGLDEETDKWQLSTSPAPTAANKMGSTIQVPIVHEIGGSLTTNGYSFPANLATGTYMCTWTVTGSSTALGSFTVGVTNCSLQAYWGNASGFQVGPNIGTTTTMTVNFVVKIDEQNASFGLSAGGTIPASVTSGDLIINKINSKIV